MTILLSLIVSCTHETQEQRLQPRQLRDVPARLLAFRFQPDVEAPTEPPSNDPKILPAIQSDFDKRHPDFALLRTIVSPDHERALAVYNTADEPTQTFRIDLYSADGMFLRDLTPPELAGVFQDSVVWSADSTLIAFIGRKSMKAEPSPTPTPAGSDKSLLAPPETSPEPESSVLPVFAPLAVFSTEQIYLCNRDGFDLKPLTTRDGLIYFALSWAPDSHALAALACKESEWDAREKEFKLPAGRPRVISVEGQERLLDDGLAQVPPVWSPDSSKIATAFDVDIGIYDAAGKAPTQAHIGLRERLLTASATFDQQSSSSQKSPTAATPGQTTDQTLNAGSDSVPVSFNPIVRIEWPVPERLYAETGYASLRIDNITFARWHLLQLSPQAVVLAR